MLKDIDTFKSNLEKMNWKRGLEENPAWKSCLLAYPFLLVMQT